MGRLHSKRLWVLLACGLFLMSVYYFLGLSANDDAYISYRYARNFLHGYGFVFNPGGAVVEGYTNFLWVILLAGASYLTRLPIELSAKIISVALVFLSASLIYKISRKLYFDNSFWVAVPIALVASVPVFMWWGLSGMETPLTTVLILGLCYVYLDVKKGKYIGTGFLLTLLMLNRPDGFVFVGVVLFDMLLGFIKRGNYRVFFTQTIYVVIPIIVIFLPYFLWRWSYFGYIFPNTYYAKVDGVPLLDRVNYGLRDLSNYIRLYGWVFALSIGSYLFGVKSFSPAIRFFYLLIIVHMFYFVYSGGDVLPHFRFIAPIIPEIVLISVFFVYSSLKQYKSKYRLFQYEVLFAVGLILIVLFSNVLNARTTGLWYTGSYNLSSKLNDSLCDSQSACDWLRKNAPPNSSIALFFVGAIPYYTDLYTIDRIGLTDTFVAHHGIRQYVGPKVHREYKNTLDYWLPMKPTFIQTWMDIKKLRQGILVNAFGLELEEDRELFRRAEFLNNYVLIVSDEFTNYSIFQRIDTVNPLCIKKNQLSSLLECDSSKSSD